jgi:hypothetical protein
MARFEYHEGGIQVLTLSADDLDKIRDASEDLYDTLANSQADVSGSIEPFRLTMVSSWANGFPFLTLNEDGATEIEVDTGAVAFTDKGSVCISNLTVKVERGGRNSLGIVVIEEGNETTREPVETQAPRVTADAVLALLSKHPLEVHALRLHFRQNDQDEVEAVVKGLRDSRRVRFDGGTYFLIGDQRVRVRPLPRGLASEIRRALMVNNSTPKTVHDICKIVGIGIEEADIALEAMIRDARVFLHEGSFSLPEPEAKKTLANLIIEELFDFEEGLTVEQLAKNLPTYHPAWIGRMADSLVTQKRVTVEDDKYVFARTERSTRSTGIMRVRTAIKEAYDSGIRLTITDLYEKFPDFQAWIIRNNVRILIETGKATMENGEVVVWNNPTKQAVKRPSFQDEIRAYLQAAGRKGVRREVILEHFAERGKGKASSALADMCTNGRARYVDGVYQVMDRPPTRFEAPF